MERYRNPAEPSARQYTAEMLAMVTVRHHGGLQDFIDPDAADAEHRIPLLHRCVVDDQYRQSRDPFFTLLAGPNELNALFTQGADEICAYVQRFQQEPRERRMFLLHLLLKQLYSCVIDADRLQTYLFESNRAYVRELDSASLCDSYAARVRTRHEEFCTTPTASETTKHIRRLRCEVAESCASFAERGTGVYSLTVPTGGGKTLSSLWYVLEHARIHGKKRIVYVIPYTTIIEQNTRTVRELLDCGDNLLEHHSHALREDGEAGGGSFFDAYAGGGMRHPRQPRRPAQFCSRPREVWQRFALPSHYARILPIAYDCIIWETSTKAKSSILRVGYRWIWKHP